MTYAEIPILRQDMATIVPTTQANLTSSTMQPYLFHREVSPHSKRSMEVINLCHCWLSSPTITGHTAVSSIRPPRPQQGSVTLHRSNHSTSHTPRTGWTSFYRVGTVASLFIRRRSPVTHVKTLCPLETIKGEPGHTSKADSPRSQH